MKMYNGLTDTDTLRCVSMSWDNPRDDGGEMWNFHRCEDGLIRGYVMLTAKNRYGECTGTININKLNAELNSEYIENVNVIFFAKNPEDQIDYVVGWYEGAKVYRNWKERKVNYRAWNDRSSYSFEVKPVSAHLIQEDKRNIKIIRAKSEEAKKQGGKFPGMSNVFFEESNESYVQSVLGEVKEFFNKERPKESISTYFSNLDDEISYLLRDPKARKDKLKNSPKIPESFNSIVTLFRRNPAVIAEVLDRANGHCEECRKIAPFKRASDGSPYLEVHHITPLSEGGEDTVKNAQALCPNCHREAHFGDKSDNY